ncbi:hypothetical protein DY000_02052488 [Brassica cretica]|uniref:PCI domain-containing protein n=1 Tax=Brassica cretica TaxID=69181 RepID=A0ABQ7ALQ6_BRACR|nr:hypothetical protein DY000_02052488 [Brassica cretica]
MFPRHQLITTLYRYLTYRTSHVAHALFCIEPAPFLELTQFAWSSSLIFILLTMLWTWFPERSKDDLDLGTRKRLSMLIDIKRVQNLKSLFEVSFGEARVAAMTWSRTFLGGSVNACLSPGLKQAVLAEKLNLNYEEAERWIVNIIRTSKLDAKIDSESGTVIMEPTQPNV